MNKKIVISLLLGAAFSLDLSAQQNPLKVNTTRQRSAQGKVSNDTVQMKTVTKELVQELPAEKDAVVKIVNSSRNLNIRLWAEDKVKIVTTVNVEESLAATITQDQLIEKSGISFKSFGNRIDIQTRSSFSAEGLTSVYNSNKSNLSGLYSSVGSAYPNGAATLFSGDNDGKYWNTTGGAMKSMTIFMPAGCRLDIDNKNTGIVINENISDARIKLNRSNLDARNFKKLYIMADYYTINISDVEEAELELENGNFTAGLIRMLDLDSEGSEIDYEGGDQLYLRSHSDRITVDEIGKVGGRKLYGDLRIGKLNTELDIEGTNADIKVRNITATVERIKINDRYADLRIPVKNITNFEVLFKGENSTVFTPFEKVITLDLKLSELNPAEKKNELKANNTTKAATPSQGHGDMTQEEFDKVRKLILTLPVAERERYLETYIKQYGSAPTGEKAPSQFKGSGGDITGKHTKFEVTCHQCSVDFK